MDPADHLCILRGGGDLATGVAWRLTRAGFPVVVYELARPLTVRRAVALSTAVTDGVVDVEGMHGRLVDDAATAHRLAGETVVPVVVAPRLEPDHPASVVVDARMAKVNIDTSVDDAPLVVGLGPGFTAGVDCDAVVETARGHHLGRVLWRGSATPNTGTPGTVGGKAAERVLRAPAAGTAVWTRTIGDLVGEGDLLGTVGGEPVHAPFDGVVRGLVAEGTPVAEGAKVGDVDPRADTPCHEISDKALAIGGGVLEAVMTWLSRSS